MALERGTLGLVDRVLVGNRRRGEGRRILGSLLVLGLAPVIMVQRGVSWTVVIGVPPWVRMRGEGRAGRCGICRWMILRLSRLRLLRLGLWAAVVVGRGRGHSRGSRCALGGVCTVHFRRNRLRVCRNRLPRPLQTRTSVLHHYGPSRLCTVRAREPPTPTPLPRPRRTRTHTTLTPSHKYTPRQGTTPPAQV